MGWGADIHTMSHPAIPKSQRWWTDMIGWGRNRFDMAKICQDLCQRLRTNGPRRIEAYHVPAQA